MNLASPPNVLLWDSDGILPSTNDYVVLWNSFSVPGSIHPSISIPEYVEEHSDRLRSRFLGFVHDVGDSPSGAKTVLEHLQIRPTFSYWWLTLFASKRWHPDSHITEAVNAAISDIQTNTHCKTYSSSICDSGATNRCASQCHPDENSES